MSALGSNRKTLIEQSELAFTYAAIGALVTLFSGVVIRAGFAALIFHG